MSDKIKLWQRKLREDLTSYIDELDNLDHIDPEKPLLICLPGVSTTHDKGRAINGYMGVAEKALGGRRANAQVQIVSVSYKNTADELVNIEKSNINPLEYYSEGAKEFAQKVLKPLLDRGIDVNIMGKSFGPVFARMAINALNDMGIHTEPHQIRAVFTGNVARLNFDRKGESTFIYIEGDNDKRAERLNRYKAAAPSNHDKLTITPMDNSALHVLTHVPESITFRKRGQGEVTVTDPQRHTTNLYCTRGRYNGDQVFVLERVARNMMVQKGENFSIDSCLNSCRPLILPEVRDYVSYMDRVISEKLQEALQRGISNNKIRAVLFDWDLTLADGEKANLKAINATFGHMLEQGIAYNGHKNWDIATMRREFFPTVPEFFERIYGSFGDTAVNMAIDKFREERFNNISDVMLQSGAKEVLLDLINKGIRIGVVSNKDEPELRRQKEVLLPEPIFRDLLLVGKVDGELSKPNPDPILYAMDKLVIMPGEAPSVVFVGDQIRSDIQAAISAGCRACLIGNGDKENLLFDAKNIINVREGWVTVQSQDGHIIEQFDTLHSFMDCINERLEKQKLLSSQGAIAFSTRV